MTKKILILGGYGNCGRRIAEILAQDPDTECVIGGRDVRRGQVVAAELKVPFVAVDASRLTSLNAALDGVFAVVNACGPFQAHDYGVAERCARRGVHYVDMANEWSYIQGIQGLTARAREGGATLVSGAGCALTFSSALVAAVSDAFDTIEKIEVAVLSGNRIPHGPASVRALLLAQGRRVRIRVGDEWREVPGFTQGRTVVLPKPFGRHRLYMTDAPEVDVLAKRYDATVTYRTGFELSFLNRGHAWLGVLHRWGVLADPTRYARGLYAIQKSLRRFGQASFGLSVVLHGQHKGQSIVRRAGLVSQNDGFSVQCAPAVALVRKWLAGGATPGAFSCDSVLTFQDMMQELKMRHVVLQLS